MKHRIHVQISHVVRTLAALFAIALIGALCLAPSPSRTTSRPASGPSTARAAAAAHSVPSSPTSLAASTPPSTVPAPSVAPSTTPASPPPTPAPVATPTTLPTSTSGPAPVVISTGSTYDAWTRVAVCEEGGWIGYAGPAYPDSLGIDAANWAAFGGGADVSPDAQIAVAERFIAHYGISIPDQSGCSGSW